MAPGQILNLFESAAAVAALARLTQLDLFTPFRSVALWLALVTLLDLSSIFPLASNTYFWLWITFTLLTSVAGILAVRELFALVFRKYPGIRTTGRWATYRAVGIAVISSFGIAHFFHANSTPHSPFLQSVELWQRSVVFSLAVVIGTILVFLSKYPLRLARNVQLSCAFFCIVFLSDAARLAIDSLTPASFNHAVDGAESVLIASCLCIWSAMLAPSGAFEAQADTAEPSLEDKRLLDQLEALNKLMSGIVRH